MAHIIEYPLQTTYFICYNADRSSITSHGVITSETKMQTGQPIVDTYLVKSEWEAVLTANNIELYLPELDV